MLRTMTESRGVVAAPVDDGALTEGATVLPDAVGEVIVDAAVESVPVLRLIVATGPGKDGPDAEIY